MPREPGPGGSVAGVVRGPLGLNDRPTLYFLPGTGALEGVNHVLHIHISSRPFLSELAIRDGRDCIPAMTQAEGPGTSQQ